MDFTKRQLKELLTNYGKTDLIFLDGQAQKHEWINRKLAAYCRDLGPDVLVTCGGMETPEQNLPKEPFAGHWEACFTMGTQWQFKPTHELYKSGTELIELLIETSAKGGNLLLNVGPQPVGEPPFGQVRLLQETGLWHAVNREALQGIEPFGVVNEGNIWYVKASGTDTVYAFMTRHPLAFGERREVLLRSLKGEGKSTISVLGHDGKTLEYRPGAYPLVPGNPGRAAGQLCTWSKAVQRLQVAQSVGAEISQRKTKEVKIIARSCCGQIVVVWRKLRILCTLGANKQPTHEST